MSHQNKGELQKLDNQRLLELLLEREQRQAMMHLADLDLLREVSGIGAARETGWRQPVNGAIEHGSRLPATDVAIAHLPAPETARGNLPPARMAVEIYAQQHPRFRANELMAEMAPRGYGRNQVYSTLSTLTVKGLLKRVGSAQYALGGGASPEASKPTATRGRPKGSDKRISPLVAGEMNRTAIARFAEERGGSFTLTELRRDKHKLKGATPVFADGNFHTVLTNQVKKGVLKRVNDKDGQPRYWLVTALRAEKAQRRTAIAKPARKVAGHGPRRPPGSVQEGIFAYAREHGGIVEVKRFRKESPGISKGGTIYTWLNNPQYFRKQQPGIFEMVGEPAQEQSFAAAASGGGGEAVSAEV